MLALQRYLAHKKPPLSLGTPQEPRHGPTEGSYGVAVSYKRGTPVPDSTRVDSRWKLLVSNLLYTSLCTGELNAI